MGAKGQLDGPHSGTWTMKVARGSLLLLLLVTHLGGSTSGEELVRVFSLQPDVWAAPRNDVFLRLNMSLQQTASSVTEMTLCQRLFQTSLTKLQVFVSYALADDFSNALLMYIINGKHFFRYNNNPQRPIERIQIPTTLRVWRHYCHVMANGNYTVYVDGEALATGPIEVEERVLLLNGSFIVGQEQDGLSTKFNSQQILKGYVAQVNLWSYGLESKDVADVAKCKRQMFGDIFSSDRDDVERVNAGVEDALLYELCSVQDNFIVFPEGRNFQDSRSMCNLIGSEIYGPLNEEMVKEMNVTIHTHELCAARGRLWVGLTDKEEEGVWRTLSDNKIVTDIVWANGQPDSGTTENCLMADTKILHSNDYSCNNPKEKACVFCALSENLHLYLRGLCMDTREETMFKVLGYRSKKPYFHEFYGLKIFKATRTRWLLFDTVANKSQASLQFLTSDQYPFGKHSWRLEVLMCGKAEGTKVELSLSACGEKDYMCDNGQCIDLDARCDAKDDCRDKTDEDNCSVLGMPKDYRSYKPPLNVEDATKPLEPEVEFQFIQFLDINDVLESIQLEFVLQIAWRDPRLKYFNLDKDVKVNKLSPEEIAETWRPTLKFINIKGGDLKRIEEDVVVKRVGKPLPYDFNAVVMNSVYSGNSSMLIQSERFSGSFNCRFDVFYYPFDAQECNVLVRLASVSSHQVSFNDTKLKVVIAQEANVSTYIVDHFVARSSGIRLQIRFMLTRRYLLIMLSVFLPSGMLCAVGYSTLFVRVAKLDVRLGVTLTTLLVLYTFFNQTSSSLPKTAYVKMIDVWFFFCTSLLFFIIVVHVVVERLDDFDSGRLNVVPFLGKTRRPPKGSGSVLVVMRLVVVPLAVVVFSVAFWSSIIL